MVQFCKISVSVAVILSLTSMAPAQADVKPENANGAVLRAFSNHDIVMLGEVHANKQEYEWLRSLVANPAFADRVDDVVVEFGNSLYQKSVDRYIGGEDVPMEQVQKAWRNTVGSFGPPSPVLFYLKDRKLMSVGMDAQANPIGTEHLVFDTTKMGNLRLGLDVPPYDVMPDGQHFVVALGPPYPVPPYYKVIVNWFDELRRLPKN